MGKFARWFFGTSSTVVKLSFLGGTVGHNDWRVSFMRELADGGVTNDRLFNPALPPGAWNDAAQKAEEEAKSRATHMLYYLADPKETGDVLPSAEVIRAVAALYQAPTKVSIALDQSGLGEKSHARKAMRNLAKLLKARFPDAKIEAGDSLSESGWTFRIASNGNGATLSTYSMVEAFMGLCDHPEKTIVAFDRAGMNEAQTSEMWMVEEMLRGMFPKGRILRSREEAKNYLVRELRD
jgi:hypothetical protein